MCMHRIFSVFFLAAWMLGVASTGYADEYPMPSTRLMQPQSPQAVPEEPFMVQQMRQNQPSQDARRTAPPAQGAEQAIEGTHFENGQEQWESDGNDTYTSPQGDTWQSQRGSRKNRDDVNAAVEKAWGDAIGGKRAPAQ